MKADLYLEQRYDEPPRDYLERFMELTSQIFDLDPKQAANLFVRGLVKCSLLHEFFLENPSYNLSELKSKAEGILRVVEGRQHIVKSTAIVISQNNSRFRETKDNTQKTRDEDSM